MGYWLGVDGGNTKCDFLLLRDDGTMLDVLRAPTCSHEALSGYDEADARMRAFAGELLARNRLSFSDLTAAAFGLAGIDSPDQRDALIARARDWCPARFDMQNDAVLGIKAASPNGAGVCCVNGTGSVVVGVDETGRVLQIGGMGALTADDAGGGYIAKRLCDLAYRQLSRGYPRTALADALLATLQLPDAHAYFMAVHHNEVYPRFAAEINIMGQELARAGDALCARVFDDVGELLGRSAAACIEALAFTAPVTVALVGSVFVKCKYPGMRDSFERHLRAGTSHDARPVLLASPPCVGAAAWAWELARGATPSADERAFLLRQLDHEGYERRVRGEDAGAPQKP